MNCLIITGGNIKESFALPYLEEHSFNCRIAVDRGLDFFYQMNIRPDYLIGDFDSANAMAVEYYRNMDGVEVVQLTPEKDDTDTEHAIHEAIRLGATSITILGATGKRMDHFLGAVSLLGIGLDAGVEIQIVDEYNRIRMIRDSLVIEREKQYGKYVSLIPFSSEVEGVTLSGMKYPLEDWTMGGFNALGISNEIVDSFARIQIKKGYLIVVESKD